MSKKQDKNIDPLMMDHDYDGIQELDNNLPTWWIGLFIITIIYGAYFVTDHLILGNQVSAEVYREQEVLMAQKAKEESKAPSVKLTALTDAASLASGKAIYMKNCMACHGLEGQGVVGPNLTDPFWIHGGSVDKIVHTIKVGVPAKGMIAWKSQLKPQKILEVTSYILSLQGSNPAGAKAPEGAKE
ncbi:MAG: c-type cytochrome [Candidatus Cloacimonetes bacterium]|nr:c-type cytochrome [Candidatus Cloacimonadota bacterium]